MLRRLLKFLRIEDGQSLVEYSLIISLVVIAAVSAVFLFGQQLGSLYEKNKIEILSNLGEK